MAIKGKGLTVNFLVWDTVNNCGKTGETGTTLALNIVKDNGAPAAVSNGVSEVNASNMPGVYRIALTPKEMEGDFICVSGRSNNVGVVVYPAFIQTEQGDLKDIYEMIQNLSLSMAAVSGKVDAIDTAINKQGGVSDSVGSILSGVNNISNSGVKLSDTGKTDVQTAVTTAIASGVNLNDTGKTDVQAAVTTAIASGVNLNDTGKTDVQTAVAAAIASGVNLNDTGKTDVQTAVTGAIASGVRLNNFGKTDVQDAVVAATVNGVRLNNAGRNDVKTAAADGVKEIELTELSALPNAANPLLTEALMLQYMVLRNKSENSKNAVKIYKSDDSALAIAVLEDDEDVFTRYKLNQISGS